MNDRDMAIALCEKLGLERIDVGEKYGVRTNEFGMVVLETGGIVLLMGGGCGYSGFYARFDFDADGHLMRHGIFK